MTDEINPERRLGALVRDNPEFASVFESVGIDYCCGGDDSLERACADADLEVGAVVERLRDSRSDGGDGTDGWNSLSALVDDIVETHHDYLRAELPSLERTVRKVVRVHGDDHPELRDIESTFLDLEDEVSHHIEDEEENVFPKLERLEDETALTGDEEARIREAIDHLEDEHDAAAAHLERLRSLTDDYAVPEGACTSYRNMLDRLRLLEEDMHLHIHKENNVMFPDAQERLETVVAE
ncbi:iron-sulfur cluster repair di-iron protein [Haloterrigena salina JCM 13891]|uniref:Iron-sulfur cluster repair di-iron protein n=1 Tax=Haloterrigena salina JCM 13891 TaxID=1227488 RepID=M0C291_9EURY|nr:iron-sulfur cluster repair di-iron protein [Haloterrigena salina]ELZ17330.1 iron-sulfur cluster repair di-iron protein [Haloterrigena salina JCM 13891]